MQGKTAVVTGASGGIGEAIARQAAGAGMNIVLADINKEGLAGVQTGLENEGAKVLSVQTDVGDRASIESLADAAYSQFGGVRLLFNNAGIMTPGSVMKIQQKDLHRMIDTNLWGTLHGMQVFMPRMLEASEGHVINTSSLNGLLAYPAMSVYNGTKAAIISISETTFHELKARNAPIGISVVCPGAVKKKEITGMKGDGSKSAHDKISKFREATGITASEVAASIFEGLTQGKFWIFTHDNFHHALNSRIEIMIGEKEPVFELPM